MVLFFLLKPIFGGCIASPAPFFRLLQAGFSAGCCMGATLAIKM